MATYQVIDLESFPRKNYYDYFMATDTTFEMTVKIDVTSSS
ncbi:CatA-like O-acetyltransferase [Virgibacillus salexigens]